VDPIEGLTPHYPRNCLGINTVALLKTDQTLVNLWRRTGIVYCSDC
jgi:hypothetical protein